MAAEDAYARWSQEKKEMFAKILDDIRKGGDPHEGASSAMLWESEARRANDYAKADAVAKGVQLAAAILSTREPEVDMGRFPGKFPSFDYAKYGMKPFFGVVDPDSIENPVARAEYADALAKQEKLLDAWGKNKYKQQEADYCIHRVQDTLAVATDKELVAKAAKDAIAVLPDGDWIRGYLRAKLFPPPEDAAVAVHRYVPETSQEPATVVTASRSPAADAPPAESATPVAPTIQPEVSRPAGERPPRSPKVSSACLSWPLMLGGVVLLVVVLSLLWWRRCLAP